MNQPPIAPGTVLGGRYRLDTRLGVGATGDVWRATTLQDGASVAIKLMSAGRHGEADVARLLGEANLPGRVSSPHVLRVLECVVSLEGGAYLVMEHVDGTDVYEYVARKGPMPLEQAALVVAQLCVALEELHRADVFHRDVKPENLILWSRQGRPCVTLVDFGIAFDGRRATVASGDTATAGTPAYMSPERLLGSVSDPLQSDLWSAAVVAYQCLVGRVPFDDRTLGSLSLAVQAGEFDLPASLRRDLPRGLDGWFIRALARDPAGRFPSAAVMREAFIGCCGPLPLVATWSPSAEDSGVFPRVSTERPRPRALGVGSAG